MKKYADLSCWVDDVNSLYCPGIMPGDALVGVRECGFRPRELPLAREILELAYGENWRKVKVGKRILGQQILWPSTIYSRQMQEMIKSLDLATDMNLKGASHIPFDGIPHNLGVMLFQSGYGASIGDPFEPSWMMRYCLSEMELSDEEAYDTWTMGHAMIFITSSKEALMKIAYKSGLEAKVIGQIKEEPGITIRSKGCFSKGDLLHFPEKRIGVMVYDNRSYGGLEIHFFSE
jgi:phosphoribosylaminoimidazole (AIR) synthetase